MDAPFWRDDGLFKLYHYCSYKASSNVFTWKGSRLQPGCFPLSFRNAAKELCWSKSKFEQKLHKLADVGCISISLVSKSTLVRIIDWAENWPSQDSTVPESSPTCPDNQPATVPLSGTDIENKKKKEDRILCPPYLPSEPEGFTELWFAYPSNRRTRRTEAASLFKFALQHGATLESILAALERDKRTETWCIADGRYIPGIVNWLKRESWRDYIKSAVSGDEEEWISW